MYAAGEKRKNTLCDEYLPRCTDIMFTFWTFYVSALLIIALDGPGIQNER